MSITFIRGDKSSAPAPASGRHAEALGDLEQAANQLLRLIAAERSGVFDGVGQSFWITEDAILRTAQELVRLAEWRVPLVPHR